MAATKHLHKVEDEIWVYDRGYWRKSSKLWKSIKSSNWDNVIMDPGIKTKLKSDIEGFFDRKADYDSFAVPWKVGLDLMILISCARLISQRGIVLQDNIYQSFDAFRPKPIPTLYVKSLGKSSDEDDIREIFDKAREAAPCLLVLEDIDSLVTDDVKSFFLNEVDGLEGNNGIMMIGSTNYRRFSTYFLYLTQSVANAYIGG